MVAFAGLRLDFSRGHRGRRDGAAHLRRGATGDQDGLASQSLRAGSPDRHDERPRADPIVWIVGAEGDQELHGFRGDTGQEIFTSEKLDGLRHFVTILAAAGRLYLAGDGQLFAFRPAP